MWWGRPGYFWGGLLVTVGLVALAANLGLLTNLNWDLFWPLVLIALGVWLIGARLLPRGPEDVRGAEFDRSDTRNGLEKAKLEIALASVRLDVRGAALGDQLYRAHVVHRGRPPEVHLDRASGTLRISQDGSWIGGGWGRVMLGLQLNDELPWAIDIRCGTARGAIDASMVPVSEFECEAGSVDIDMSAPKPTGEVAVRVEGGSVRLRVRRPSGAQAHATASGGSIRFTADGVRQGGVGHIDWQSAGLDSSSDRYEMRFAGGSVDVDLGQA